MKNNILYGKTYRKFFNEDDSMKEGVAAVNPWLVLLTDTENSYVNVERLASTENRTHRETLEYVCRSLDILDAFQDELSPYEDYLIRTTLAWSETAKGGSGKQRKAWREKGYPLEIHNLASASIYEEYYGCGGIDHRIVALLIRTHGLIGQSIRGEVALADSLDLRQLVTSCRLDAEQAEKVLHVLNACVIMAASEEIWNRVEGQVRACIRAILTEKEGCLREMSPRERLEALLPAAADIPEELVGFFRDKVFPRFDLWYFESALGSFSPSEVLRIMEIVLSFCEGDEVRHLNFKALSDSLYYDYEGRRHVNVYKKRIIEKYLRGGQIREIEPQASVEGGICSFGFAFLPVCQKLIDFCVEAEHSGLLTFEKSIIALYDMFGYRRDEFDRLNNEDKYLRTMNSAEESTKSTILDYVCGKSAVDVGSGGGVLLDRLEEKYPGLEIVGTDISANVIDALRKKKEEEGHGWTVLRHNFVDAVLERRADNIIFSSILHEVYSYTETENGKFDLSSVKNALKNAALSLNPGGRIIIRDGIKTDSTEEIMIRFRDENGPDFFENYRRDFKGLKELSEEQKVSAFDKDKRIVRGNVNFLREFLYTYTWGNESYAHEVQEQFGYMTLREFTDCLTGMGLRILKAIEFLEPGYPEHLDAKVELLDAEGRPAAYPNSNCIIVAELQ
ncbi:MAG: methyltransferase [Lachnospiraceae bacterium]|nr:methyltransferase [Lachnospiraceae bacterium]